MYESGLDPDVEYREVEGYAGYLVGADGSVWSNKVVGSRFGRTGGWRRLKPATKVSGHQFVGLSRNATVWQVLVHRLVLVAFVGPCPEGMEGCHNDGNPKNNALSNLRWDTPKGNRADTLLHGTRNHGSRHGMAKATEDIVRSIRDEHAAGGITQRKLAAKHGLSVANICLIIRRKAWTHI